MVVARRPGDCPEARYQGPGTGQGPGRRSRVQSDDVSTPTRCPICRLRGTGCCPQRGSRVQGRQWRQCGYRHGGCVGAGRATSAVHRVLGHCRLRVARSVMSSRGAGGLRADGASGVRRRQLAAGRASRRWLMDIGNGPKRKLPRWVTRPSCAEPCGSTGQAGAPVTNRPCSTWVVSALLGADALGIIAAPADWPVTCRRTRTTDDGRTSFSRSWRRFASRSAPAPARRRCPR